MPPIVTVLTDFGLADTYVGQVKGAILRVAPSVSLVDLTHAVPPQDVCAGAFLLWAAVEAFPAGTIHLAVVDPGVGSARRAIAARAARGDYLVGPDNGLLLPAVERLGGVVLAVELTEPAYWRGSPSATFHGRDIFGPVAGHLASGVPLERLGPPLAELSRPFTIPGWRRDGTRLVGEVLHVDVYGNLVTSIPAGMLPPRFCVRIGRHLIPDAPQPHYQAVPHGSLLALVGSAGLLEISAREANAATITGAERGQQIAVDPQ